MSEQDKDHMTNYYRTSNFPLAVVLSLHFPVEDIEKEHNSQRAFFVFKSTPELEQVISDYWADSLRIEPKEFYNQTKTLKSRLREGFIKNEK